MRPFNLFSLNWYNSLIFFLGLFFFSLSVYKASHMAFTHDESFTYLSYVKKNLIGIISMEEPVSANNHILNSLGMKVVDKLMSPTPFNLRLPNLFGHLLFIFFSALFVADFKNNFFKVIAFIVLNANIYQIDLFSLARGYGLSLGFLMAHWYFLIQTIVNTKTKYHFRLTFLTLFLASIANFSILYYAFAFVLIYLFLEIKIILNKDKISSLLLHFKFLIGLFIISLLFFYQPIYKLIKFKQLYFGGTNNFFDDTVYTLVFYSFGNASSNENNILLAYNVILVFLILIFSYFIFKLYSNEIFTSTNYFVAVLFIIILLEIILFYQFDSKYLIQRTAVFLIPLFTITVLKIINEFNYNPLYFSFGLIGFFYFYFTIRFIPLTNCLNWKYDADNEMLILDLNKIYLSSYDKSKMSLGIDWIFQPSLNFYRATSDTRTWLDTLTKEGYQNKNYQYYFVESNNLSKFVDTTKFKIVKTYTNTNNSLIKSLEFE